MDLSGLLSLINCAKITLLYANTPQFNGPSVMGWFEKLMDPKKWAHYFVYHTKTCMKLG